MTISGVRLSTPYKNKLIKELIDKIRKDFNLIISKYWENKTKIEYDKLKLSTILDSYFSLEAPFSIKKPNEFKDSIVLNAILKHAQGYFTHAHIISPDNDWKNFAQSKHKSNKEDPNSELIDNSNYLSHFSDILECIAYLKGVINTYNKLKSFCSLISDDLKDSLELYDNYVDFRHGIGIRIDKKDNNIYQFYLEWHIYFYEKGAIDHSDIIAGIKWFNQSDGSIKELLMNITGTIKDNKIVNFQPEEGFYLRGFSEDLEKRALTDLIFKLFEKKNYYNNFELP